MDESAIKIGKKAFLFSVSIILLLMIFSGVLTMVLPSGTYDRFIENGRTMVVNDSYRETAKPNYPFWRWFAAPLEVLVTGPDNITPIVVILFIAVVGGSISVLEGAGILSNLVNMLVTRFAKKKYLLIALIILFFMSIASFVGIYEGMIPMVIFIIPIAISLGWDSLTGLGLSLLALSFGFFSAVTNPFTIAVPQRIADLPLFSGAWLRIIFFALIYCIVTFFMIRYAKKIEANPSKSLCYKEDEALRKKLLGNKSVTEKKAAMDKRSWRALFWFCGCLLTAMIIVVTGARIPGLSDLAFPVMALLFLIGGIGGGFIAGLGARKTGSSFGKGVINILPGIFLVLMAYSVKHIIVTGQIMDTILFNAAELIRKSPPMTAAFLIYAITLVMNFFIPSASAKAFLMMPILAPLADLVGVTRQTAVLAFDFGDGFCSMLFPTNPLLLVALSFSTIGYTKWIAWTWKLQILVFLVTAAFLVFAVKIGFGPF